MFYQMLNVLNVLEKFVVDPALSLCGHTDTHIQIINIWFYCWDVIRRYPILFFKCVLFSCIVTVSFPPSWPAFSLSFLSQCPQSSLRMSSLMLYQFINFRFAWLIWVVRILPFSSLYNAINYSRLVHSTTCHCMIPVGSGKYFIITASSNIWDNGTIEYRHCQANYKITCFTLSAIPTVR